MLQLKQQHLQLFGLCLNILRIIEKRGQLLSHHLMAEGLPSFCVFQYKHELEAI